MFMNRMLIFVIRDVYFDLNVYLWECKYLEFCIRVLVIFMGDNN